MGRYIVVAGNIGSGKTTLVRALAERINWKPVTEKGVDEKTLQHLFADPPSWAFLVQMAFLTNKILNMKADLKAGHDFLVDRSAYEDVEVFAKLFGSTGSISADQYSVYLAYADKALRDLPPPLVVIYCKCPAETCEERVLGRPRPYQPSYPSGHTQRLHDLYENWIANFDTCPILALDTELHDIRKKTVIDEIVKELTTLLTTLSSAGSKQLKIFPTLSLSERTASSELRLQSVGTAILQPYVSTKIARRQRKRITKPPPSVYIAAPFTGIAEEVSLNHIDETSSGAPTMFALPRKHGIIPAGWYRSLLIDIARSFRRHGYHPILPHRDVNKWGEKELSPSEVGKQCLELVESCDMFFGILGLSYGAHVEAGVALGLQKPSILVAIGSNEDTFIGMALMESGTAASLRFQNSKDLKRFLKSPSFGREIRRALEINRRRL
jgi:deoxyadenosine/deoxycytidine kinase